ncbi:uncharacterized protein LOC118815989 [Colossoma macropomum]|uniref:uncharacterized protein LOC118815989 n=1 Tax=Colossoma macropomum TaxID=42526 RepID=UPI001863F15E|nr:uncharacterized protein LOC118815989 [Colossoma macropomum]
MAQSKELVSTNEEWNPVFTEELLPCSQKVSLLYHLSYLCLGKFSNCERLLRMRVLETQLLFVSSEAVLLKCLGTSQNLVSALFPMLKLAVEKDKPEIAKNYLEKARTWIEENIQEVNRIIERYDLLNKNLALSTLDINAEKTEMEKKSAQLLQENEEIKKTLKTLEEMLEETNEKLTETEKTIGDKNLELQNLVKHFVSFSKQGHKRFEQLSASVPFTIECSSALATSPGAVEKINTLQSEVNRLASEKATLSQKQWDIQVQITDWQMKLAKQKIDQDSIPDEVHLGKVQHNLSLMQQIFNKLGKFWEKVHKNLGIIKDKTVEDFVDPDLKEGFLMIIEKALEIWGRFGGSFGKGAQIFRAQSRDAYHYLEIDPSSLSEEEWQKEYDSVKNQLREIKVFSGEYDSNQITQAE